MIWTLLWKFRKYIAVVVLLSTLSGMACGLIKNYASKKADEAVKEEKKKQIGIDSEYMNIIIQDNNARIDSIVSANAKEIKERTAVQEHKKKLATVQRVEQEQIDSFVAQVRDSAVKVVVDSLSWHYKVVVGRLEDQLIDAGTIETSLNREINRLNSIIELKNTQMDALQDFNERLHADCDPTLVVKKHGVGHFIVHKALPVVALGTFITVGVVRTVHELEDK